MLSIELIWNIDTSEIIEVQLSTRCITSHFGILKVLGRMKSIFIMSLDNFVNKYKNLLSKQYGKQKISIMHIVPKKIQFRC